MEIVWSIGIIIMICIALPCLLVRPLFLAIADRIAGKKSNARELQELKDRISYLENRLDGVRSQVIGLETKTAEIESSQEFSHKLLEDLKAKKNSET